MQATEMLDLSFLKILVAEDNQINQRVIQKMLEKTGVRFKIVQSGREVLEALRDEYFDLVLMDCYMGDMDGFEAAKAIRASNERFAQIPLIAFSAGLFDSDRQASREAGMDDFLSKPLRYESLQEKLLEWVSRIDKKLPVLDVTALDKIRVFDDQHCSLLRSLFQIYSENTQDELSQMRDLILDVDMDRVRKKAHMLKSSAAQLGALRFERICILMELEVSLTVERAQILHKRMCKEYEDSRQRFAEYCRSLSQAVGVPLKDSLSL